MKELSGVRKSYELKIGEKIYSFRLSFMCWLELEKRYGTNATYIVDDFIIGIDRITNMMRILSCACSEYITAEELGEQIEFIPKNLEVLTEITIAISGLNKKDVSENVKKNMTTPPKDSNIVDYDFYYAIARAYLGYTYNEFWYEANPYEVIETWNAYVKMNGWDKKEDEENEDEENKTYYTIDDL